LNDRGHVAGWAGADWGYEKGHAFLWRDGEMIGLGTVGGREYGWAYGLNERDEVVGISYDLDEDGMQLRTRAFLWRHGRMIDLGTVTESGDSWAEDINERGQVLITTSEYADEARFIPSNRHAFVWWNGEATDLGDVHPIALNDRGQVIAWTGTSVDRTSGRSVLWHDGPTTDLGTLGGPLTRAAAIDSGGRVVGTSTTAAGLERAFLWRDGAIADLGTLPGGRGSGAVAINERGQIVGWSEAADGASHAVLWTLP
jgi:probable HAF family extracellular repeat protein